MSDNKVSQIMNVSETADYLRVSQATIYRLARGGQIPCAKVGKTWRFHRIAIDKWLASKHSDSDAILEQKPNE